MIEIGIEIDESLWWIIVQNKYGFNICTTWHNPKVLLHNIHLMYCKWILKYVSVCMHCICVVYRCRCHCRSGISHQVNITSIYFFVGVLCTFMTKCFVKTAELSRRSFLYPSLTHPLSCPPMKTYWVLKYFHLFFLYFYLIRLYWLNCRHRIS